MKKPIILIPATYLVPEILPVFKNYSSRESNINSVIDAGGIPIIAPYWASEEDIAQMVSMADGVFMAGGEDVEPSEYGEERRPECEASVPERDKFELAIIKEALKQDKPMLCICRGMQILNVALGGTLYQDLKTNMPNAIDHTVYDAYATGSHNVKIEKDSRLYGFMGKEELFVNSLHHQGVKDLADGLKATAKTSDGLVEAVEMPGKTYVLGSQWHPEFMPKDNEQYQKQFADFIAACQK